MGLKIEEIEHVSLKFMQNFFNYSIKMFTF